MFVFKPVKPRHISGRAELVIAKVNPQKKEYGPSIRVSISGKVLKDLRWINGDRLVVRFDDKADAWMIERVPSASAGDGYKLLIPPKGGANCAGTIRVAATDEMCDVIFGKSGESRDYQFFEAKGNVATFVPREE